ncbi:hypothetical protein C7418_0422 [Cupriavidus plantarum]|nr:hypothetical protein C7418_0422 [Cupriavidus plantarum]
MARAAANVARDVAGDVAGGAARHVCRWAVLPACVMLWGCPEQIGPNAPSDKAGTQTSHTVGTKGATTPGNATTSGGTSAGTSAGTSVEQPAGDLATENPVPKPDGDDKAAVVYRGTLSFGGTVVVALNQPEAGMATIRFDDSDFGLQGAIVGSVRVAPGRGEQLVTAIAAAGGDPPPDEVIAALPRIKVRIGIRDGILRGDIEGLPNVALMRGGEPRGIMKTRHPGSPQLAGLIHAVRSDTAPPLASLAGTYTYMMEGAKYPDKFHAPLIGSQVAQVGQLRIDSDGMFRACPNQIYADACESAGGNDTVTAAALRLADQTRYPGQFELWDEGMAIGRIFAQEIDGKWHLRMWQHQPVAADTVKRATWVMQSGANALRPGYMDGAWECREPGLDAEARTLNPPPLDGAILPMKMVAKGTVLANDEMVPAEIADLTFDAGFIADGASRPASLPGVVHVSWMQAPTPVGVADPRQQVILPIDEQTFVYLREPDAAEDSAVWGRCGRWLNKRPGR